MVNGNAYSFVVGDGIVDTYWVRDDEHTATFVAYSEIYRVNAGAQPPEENKKVTLTFVETDSLNMGFVGPYTGVFQVSKDKTLAEQGITLPRVGNELTAGVGYKPVFKYKGNAITDLNFKLDADAEIRVEAVKEGTTDPAQTYYVFYEFESISKGKGLPQEVTEFLPEDDIEYKNGAVVRAILPKKTQVTVADGTWIFKGYDMAPQMVMADDVRFNGKWVFTKKAAMINQPPVIHANDRTLTVGEEFDPLEGVRAEDPEEGILPMTDKNIIENNVDKQHVGNYVVVFTVADQAGARTEKMIKVTVKNKEEAGKEDPKPEDPKPENPKPEDPKPDVPQPENPKPDVPQPENPASGGAKKMEQKKEQTKQENAASAVKAPKTGDRAPSALLAGVAVIAVVVLAVIFTKKRFKK